MMACPALYRHGPACPYGIHRSRKRKFVSQPPVFPTRHGPACPAQPRQHRAARGGPDKPGHDDIEHDRRKSFPRSVNAVGTSGAMTVSPDSDRSMVRSVSISPRSLNCNFVSVECADNYPSPVSGPGRRSVIKYEKWPGVGGPAKCVNPGGCLS